VRRGDAPVPAGPPGFLFAYAAWTLELAAALGSVFFGEVMGLTPCTLCWYQRICLFPLVVVLAVGIVLRDERLVVYAMPFVLAGLGFSIYHNLLQAGVISEALSPCTGGVPCSERQVEWLGFVTIPMMSAAAFGGILASLVAHLSTRRGPGRRPQAAAARRRRAAR